MITINYVFEQRLSFYHALTSEDKLLLLRENRYLDKGNKTLLRRVLSNDVTIKKLIEELRFSINK